jgi:hypothetical protein
MVQRDYQTENGSIEIRKCLLLRASTRLPEPPSASRIAMLGLEKPSQPQPSNDLSMRVQDLSSNMQGGSLACLFPCWPEVFP